MATEFAATTAPDKHKNDEHETDTSMKAFTDALQSHGEFYPTGPMCWGPVQWMALHQMARGYPLTSPSKEKQEGVKAYVMGLVELLPCSICATHWRVIAPTVEAHTSSRNALLKWTIDVHNAVNERTKGKKAVLSYRQAIDTIIMQCAGNRLTVSTIGAASDSTTPLPSHEHRKCSETAVKVLATTSALLALASVIFFILFILSRRKLSKP